jgi:hypothetical protein
MAHPMTSNDWLSATISGNLTLMKWIYAIDGMPKCDMYICTAAAALYGHLEILKWFYEELKYSTDTPAFHIICSEAIRGGSHLDILRWWCTKGYRLSVLSCITAIQYGRVQALEWLYSQGAPFDEKSCAMAIEYNQPKVLEYLHSVGLKD